MSEDLRVITGELRVEGTDCLTLDDPLARLPLPTHDLDQRRTFSHRPEPGRLTLLPGPPGAATGFVVQPPRRYDAAGVVPGHGLFSNGLWHPQLTCGGQPLSAVWTVTLHLPAGAVGALNGELAHETLRWRGEATHLALAVIPEGQLTVLSDGVVYVGARPLPRRAQARLNEALSPGWPMAPARPLVIIETPNRRRLARTGPHTLYLSDRALRLSAGLWRYHKAAVWQGALTAGLPIPGDYERAVAAAVYARGQGPDAAALLGPARFLPQIDAILYDGTLPFYSEVFGEPWPSDPLLDDISELYAPRLPPAALVAQVEARGGPQAPLRLADRLLAGQPLAEALDEEGLGAIPSARPPVETASVEVSSRGGTTTITLRREGQAELPPAAIAYEIDGQHYLWEAPAGDAILGRTMSDRPDRVRLDPEGALHDPDRADNTWPRRWSITGAAYPYTLSLRSGRIAGGADLIFRRPYNSPAALSAGLFTDEQDLVGIDLSYYRALGPLQDRRRRPFRTYVSLMPSLLDPSFRPTEGSPIALGFATGLAYETRTDSVFPRHGHRIGMSLGGGLVPGGAAWSSVGLGGAVLLPLGGRLVLASRAGGTLAQGDVAHRQLSLGGGEAVSGVPAEALVGERRATAATELRAQPLRFASVPLPLAWLSDLQLNAGLEGGWLGGVEGDGGAAHAVGWTAGVLGTADVFGARPSMLGLWAARPLWADPASLLADPTPQLYLRMYQAF